MRARTRTLEGSWRARDLGAGLWRFEAAPPRDAQVHLIGVSSLRATTPATRGAGLTLEWQSTGVCLTHYAPPDERTFTARQAIVHEPVPALYEALPLEHLDSRARRFWARVFLLVRLPGGRHLLKRLARRGR